MSGKQRDAFRRASKRLSWLLRHGAHESGLAMDSAGWALVEDVRRVLRIDQPTLEQAVRENAKQRLQLDGARIRCSQGHSLAGTPVSLEGLEASWEPLGERVESLFHGTRLDPLPAIFRDGLVPMGRTHVHLADAPDSTVGKRASVAVLLEIAPVMPIWISPNGVYLARSVPPEAIVGLRPMTRAARAAQAELDALLGR